MTWLVNGLTDDVSEEMEGCRVGMQENDVFSLMKDKEALEHKLDAHLDELKMVRIALQRYIHQLLAVVFLISIFFSLSVSAFVFVY